MRFLSLFLSLSLLLLLFFYSPLSINAAASSSLIDKKLESIEKSLTKTMKALKGDRFSESSGTLLRTSANDISSSPSDLFSSRSLYAFWLLHRGYLNDSLKYFLSIINDKLAPSEATLKAIKLCVGLVESLIKNPPTPNNNNNEENNDEKTHSESELLFERESLLKARQLLTTMEPLTSSNEKIDWLWEKLFSAEARWLIQNLPDHNNKDNSKCVYHKGLWARAYHPTNRFPSAVLLEKNYDKIMEEVLPFLAADARRAKNGDGKVLFNNVGGNTAETDANLVLRGKWTDVSLYSAGVRNKEACKSLPVLCKLIEEEIPEVSKNLMGHALLSRLSPGTVVKRHHGYTNSQLTMHLGLIIPETNLGMEVNGIKGRWHTGKVIVFDDSFYHSVWHNGTAADGVRVVLLLRAYHPEWSLEERANLILTHTESPWTTEERANEVKRLLNNPTVREKWEQDKKLFQEGPEQEKEKENNKDNNNNKEEEREGEKKDNTVKTESSKGIHQEL